MICAKSADKFQPNVETTMVVGWCLWHAGCPSICDWPCCRAFHRRNLASVIQRASIPSGWRCHVSGQLQAVAFPRAVQNRRHQEEEVSNFWLLFCAPCAVQCLNVLLCSFWLPVPKTRLDCLILSFLSHSSFNTLNTQLAKNIRNL